MTDTQTLTVIVILCLGAVCLILFFYLFILPILEEAWDFLKSCKYKIGRFDESIRRDFLNTKNEEEILVLKAQVLLGLWAIILVLWIMIFHRDISYNLGGYLDFSILFWAYIIWEIGRKKNWARWMALIVFMAPTLSLFVPTLVKAIFELHLSTIGYVFFIGGAPAYAFILLFKWPTKKLFEKYQGRVKWQLALLGILFFCFLEWSLFKMEHKNYEFLSSISETKYQTAIPTASQIQNSSLDETFKITYPSIRGDSHDQYLQTSIGEIKIGYDDDKNVHVLLLNGKKIDSLSVGSIHLIGLYQKNERELLLYSSQMMGTCCGSFSELYAGIITDGKIQFKDIATINSGLEEQLQSRVTPLKDTLLVDLDISEKKHHYVSIKADGTFKETQEDIPNEGLAPAECDEIVSDLKNCAMGGLANVQMQMISYYENTKTKFNGTAFHDACNRAIKIKKSPSIHYIKKHICVLAE